MFWNQFGDFIDLDPDPQNFLNLDPHHWIVINFGPLDPFDDFWIIRIEIVIFCLKYPDLTLIQIIAVIEKDIAVAQCARNWIAKFLSSIPAPHILSGAVYTHWGTQAYDGDMVHNITYLVAFREKFVPAETGMLAEIDKSR